MRLIDADTLKKALKSNCTPELCHDYNTAWCESCCLHNFFEDLIDDAPTVEPERPQGKTCRHRDPEDKKCDYGGQERIGCHFPVRDDYFCKYYEKGGAEE